MSVKNGKTQYGIFYSVQHNSFLEDGKAARNAISLTGETTIYLR
jgi:hypothetical protein